MLLAVDLDEDFIDVERVSVTTVLSLQSAGINGTEFYAPETDRFSADGYASLSQQTFNISVAEIESKIEPDSSCSYFRLEENETPLTERRHSHGYS